MSQARRPVRKRGGTSDEMSHEPSKELDDNGAEDGRDEDAEDEGEAEEEEEEEEEVTRCICEQLDYPGPPFAAPTEDLERGSRDEQAPQSPLGSADAPVDELGSLFIQCDTCKVWQHGGCVGIMEVSMSPDEYFCELCRGDLHSITIGPRG